MRRLSTWILIAAALAALAFLAAPWFAFRALRANALDQDVQGLAELVDYPALRASLRPQLAAVPTAPAPPPSVWRDPVGALRRAIEPLTPAPPQVDRYMAPAGLYALTVGERPPPIGTVPQPVARPPFPGLRYWGFRRVRFAVRTRSDAGAAVHFTFQRRGLYAWRLVHVGLPQALAVP